MLCAVRESEKDSGHELSIMKENKKGPVIIANYNTLPLHNTVDRPTWEYV